jgi:hypothetical protein
MDVPSATQQLAPADLADLVGEPEAVILGQGPGGAQQDGGGVVEPAEGVEIVGERIAGHRFDQHQGAVESQARRAWAAAPRW